ncbi:polyprenyl synthetase family protein [Planctomicrobium piriforme]|uniref:Octaprenyl-diphosphate synthase n=1 Tax=Planctomicrobium piriforme TaxID=1576369 RepID=A0A1I3S9L3_9PLAN|nr:polyprenyl synthetase family protein [Planctomicrobium piriforme]SFJ55398.1 octaprenyl-diphosphate synthase [Planctomicrobium piriforme]
MAQLRNVTELLERTQAILGDALLDVERQFDDELASSNPYICDILEHTRRFRGKRLRPLLCLLVAKAVGDIEREHLILAAVVEMIHTATLVHDDVLDEAAVRRHVATVNVRWNNQTSVLYGDFLFTHAFHLAASTGSADACRLIGRATNRVCEGELMQTRNRGNLSLTEEEYFSIIDGKTAELCAVSCEIGARYAGGSDAVVEAMERYGRNLGLAFQIADDVLDLTGLESSIGKTLGTDLEQQKLTLPIIRLLQLCPAEQREQLLLQLEDSSESACREVLRQARELGAVEDSLATARRCASEARQALEILPASPARELLMLLPTMSIDRSC